MNSQDKATTKHPDQRQVDALERIALALEVLGAVELARTNVSSAESGAEPIPFTALIAASIKSFKEARAMPSEQVGRKEVIEDCSECPIRQHDYHGAARCFLAWDKGITTHSRRTMIQPPPPAWCPLRSGPVTVSLRTGKEAE